ncbi:peptidoglycan DD-metalloendopeptidase family protein [Hyphococcus luteus]|uniref:M23ase beta-sheet core domain-containing protein n=1 Tax=Hyphococcus luteus TaxID=2058213 RepID=A0A2S7K2D7_9PROT|nr:peptidoglycan DD-metalloendopeptidase family protein [Marinicaulis flavus]PQA86674.1 hypothetical protein CW354_14350 [Marinicaulis flavus]
MKFLLRLLRRLLVMLIVPAIFLAAGWYGGSKYGAPPAVVGAVDNVFAKGRAILTPILGEAARKGGEAAKTAAQQGSDYVVGTVEQMIKDYKERSEEEPGEAPETQEGETPDTDEPAPAEPPATEPEPQPSAAPVQTGDGIVLCKMRISNQPRQGAPGSSIGAADETTTYKGVTLLLMPATKACLSSGYGYRNGKLHKGVDYFSDRGGDVLAAGDGTIVEAVSRSDYGNMVVIDHGNGVYTRYAHLARFASGVKKGAAVTMGQTLGPIGKSGAAPVVHLHYEVLTGGYGTRAKSFGLEAVDPFGL